MKVQLKPGPETPSNLTDKDMAPGDLALKDGMIMLKTAWGGIHQIGGDWCWSGNCYGKGSANQPIDRILRPGDVIEIV